MWQGSGKRERRLQGLGLGKAYRWCGEKEARCRSWREGNVDMGRLWRAWWCSGERERRERGPGGSWRRLRERERRE